MAQKIIRYKQKLNGESVKALKKYLKQYLIK